MKKRAEKKAQANIITILLILLLSFVAIIIVWNAVIPLIQKSGEKIELGTVTTNLEIAESKLWITGGAKIKIHRNTGKGNLSEIKIIFYDENGNTIIIPESNIPAELETKEYNFASSEIGNKKIQKVSIMPVFEKNLGPEIKESERKIKKDSNGKRILDLPNPEQVSTSEWSNIGLVGWWKFEGNAEDSVGGNNGDKVGNAEFINGYLSLNGDGGISIPSSINNPEFNLQEFTVSFWIKETDNVDWASFVNKGFHVKSGNPGSQDWGFLSPGGTKSDKTGVIWSLYEDTFWESLYYYEDFNADNPRWINIAGTYDGETATLYIDGENYQEKPITNINFIGQTPLTFGINNYDIDSQYNYKMKGYLDEVMLFNKALSQDNIKSIYENQKR